MTTRHFTSLPGRQVHYRCCGAGMPLVMVHQSPQDSSDFEGLIALLGQRFTVLAPDTPGYGLSTPIAAPDDEPALDRFVDALIEWLAAMGLSRACFYGLHSGATIAARLAARRPDLVEALVLNGVAVLEAQERREILARYLPAFRPAWDGSHMTWLWSRMREQSLVFPWYAAMAEAEPEGTGASLAEMADHAHRLLLAGDNYRTAYRAVFAHSGEADLANIRCPITLLVEQDDPLTAQFKRLRFDTPPAVAHIHGDESIAAAVGQALAAVTLPSWGLPQDTATPSRMMTLDQGQLHMRQLEGGQGRPLLLLHEAATSGRAFAALASTFRDHAPVLVPDLPGHGDSYGFEEVPAAAEPTARVLCEMLDRLGVEADVVSFGSSVAIGAALSTQSKRVTRHVTVNPVARNHRIDSAIAIPPQPDSEGAYLLAAWRLARGFGLDRAAFAPTRALAGLGELAPLAATQTAAVDILKHVRLTGRPVASFAMPAEPSRPADHTFVVQWSKIAACGDNLPGPDPVHWPAAITKALQTH